MDTTVWKESMVYESLDSVGYDCGMWTCGREEKCQIRSILNYNCFSKTAMRLNGQ